MSPAIPEKQSNTAARIAPVYGRAPLRETYVITYGCGMKTVTATGARQNLYRLLEEVHDEPVQIVGKNTTAVLVSEEDWRAVQETMYLLSIPGMRESILAGMTEPLEDTSAEPGW